MKSEIILDNDEKVIEEYFTLSYKNKSPWSQYSIGGKVKLTNKRLIIPYHGIKRWQLFLMFVPIIWFFAVLWMLVSFFIRNYQDILLKDIKSVDIIRIKTSIFHIVGVIKVTDTSDKEYYFQPLLETKRGFIGMAKNNEELTTAFAEEIRSIIKKKTPQKRKTK